MSRPVMLPCASRKAAPSRQYELLIAASMLARPTSISAAALASDVRFGLIMERSSTISVAQVTTKCAPAAGPTPGPSAYRLSVKLN